jgi:proteasome lid subunit RPN8/RPN11
MGLFRSREVIGIADDALSFVLEASAETHPNEYMGFLRAERLDRLDPDAELALGDARGSDLVVVDVLVIPGTTSNPVSATVRENLVPNDSLTVGSVHSHPNGVLRPSDADLGTFGSGSVHVIVGAPYGRDDWRAFDREGEVRDLPVLDIPLPDPEEFFDFTQEDIDAEL